MEKTLVIAVDLQNDFMNKNGALYVPGAEDIKEEVNDFMYRAMRALDTNHKIWYTADLHDYDDEEISTHPDLTNTFPPHCIRNTEGSWLIDHATGNEYSSEAILEESMPPFASVYYKNKFSVFEGNSAFEADIIDDMYNTDKIFIFGVAGDICVKGVLDGMVQLIEYGRSDCRQIVVLLDLIASIDDKKFIKYIKKLVYDYEYITVAFSEDVVFEI